jgi:hypothetical protein
MLIINYGQTFSYVSEKSEVERIDYISDRISHIKLILSWCKISVLNVHAPTEDKGDDTKDSFHEELTVYLINYRRTTRKLP